MMRIRIDPEMKERLQREADFNHRSLNAEILHRLQISLDGPRESAGVGEPGMGYPLSDGERVLLGKLRRLGGRHAATAADVIDALASSSNDAE